MFTGTFVVIWIYVLAVLRILDMLVRILIRGSVPLTN
jgi:hypothetical protein